MMLRRREGTSPQTPLAALMSTGRDELDSGSLVRALARSVVHVPMPGAAPEQQPRVVTGDDPALYVVEDDEGRHAFLYSSARRLVDAFGAGTGAASVPFPTLLLGWPDGVDLVLDPGTPDALEVPLAVLQHVRLEIAGVPTGTSVQPSPGDRPRLPAVELVQLIGATRTLAERLPEVRALWRSETLPDVPSTRPVLDLHVDLDAVTEERRHAVLQLLGDAAAEAEPRPLRVTASVEGVPCSDLELVTAVKALDAPYYVRD